MQVYNTTQDLVIAAELLRAESFSTRLKGLMFQKEMAPGEGLLIRPCQQVHTHFMRFPIDVIFLSEQWQVVEVICDMEPWRFSPLVKEAVMVLEVPAGAAGTTGPGDVLELR